MLRRPGMATVLAASCLVVWTTPSRAAAEPGGERQEQPAPTPDRTADFFFGRPKGTLGVRGGWLFASAGSDIFDFVTRQLTIDKADFDTPGFAAEGGVALTERADLVGGVEIHRMSHLSNYRDFIDNTGRPIEQTTTLSTNHFYASLRFALAPKGVEVSRLVWVPRRVVPFVGAGAGVTRYAFRQFGDFVDFQTFDVFTDSFASTGWAPTMHAFGGVDLHVYRSLYATVQARYTKASGKLSSDFIDFDPIDLSGVRLSAGINLFF